MYAELIYTRCRQGIDILREGRPITSDGYKVYSCTSSLMRDGSIDLQFLLNAAQAKLPYNEPQFMDDAYLYFVPEKGSCFMQNFYPVPFDPNAKGDYAHRAGNFVNHIIVGDFSDFYPFELFRDNDVWNAKARDEGYYYTNTPTDLSARNDISDPAGQFGVEEIGVFISDGRQEAFMSAVSFLISQYGLPVEERKFLLIRDDSEEKIEMWIAAIEYAFSPRMAASIPFATRMDKFATANKYTINQMGVYQTQINLQDKNQKLRYRAMIVGVDERDRVNAGTARPLANSPFVLLDGKEKKAMFDADISNRYYRFITGFGGAQQSFCREFLQSINITVPTSDIYRLLDIYTILCESPSLPTSKETAKVLAFFGKYELLPSSKLEKIYATITAELPRFLQEDLNSAMQVIKWLQSTARVVGDGNASTRLTDIVCKVFAEQVFRKLDSEGTWEFWQNIKNGEFAPDVSRYFVDPATLQVNQAYLQRFAPADKLTYVLIFLDCAAISGTANAESLKSVVNWGLELCCSRKDTNAAKEILKALGQNRKVDVQGVLFSIAKDAERSYAEFIVMFLIEFDESIIESTNSMLTFLNKLKADRMEHLYGAVLKFRAKALTRATEIDEMIRLLDHVTGLCAIDQAEIYACLDKKLSLTEKSSLTVAKTILERVPHGAVCPKSAHLIALEVLGDKKQRQCFTEIYNELISHGFPSVNNAAYIDALINALFKARISSQELVYVVQLFYREPPYINALVAAILGVTTAKETEDWNTLIHVAAKKQDENLVDALINECAKLKQGEKAINQLGDMLDKRDTRDYFVRTIAPEAKNIIRSQKSPGLFGGLFSRDDGLKKKK